MRKYFIVIILSWIGFSAVSQELNLRSPLMPTRFKPRIGDIQRYGGPLPTEYTQMTNDSFNGHENQLHPFLNITKMPSIGNFANANYLGPTYLQQR
jgi:hypothetical protein